MIDLSQEALARQREEDAVAIAALCSRCASRQLARAAVRRRTWARRLGVWQRRAARRLAATWAVNLWRAVP